MEPNTIVWAKYGNHPYWPSRIVNETEVKGKALKSKSSSSHVLICFFGTHNYAWVPRKCIKDYDKYYDEFSAKYNSSDFRKVAFISCICFWNKQSTYFSCLNVRLCWRSANGKKDHEMSPFQKALPSVQQSSNRTHL
jgi:hypothetical protein